MCYNYAIKAAKQEIEERYNATFYYDEDDEPLFLDIHANGFTHLKMPKNLIKYSYFIGA